MWTREYLREAKLAAQRCRAPAIARCLKVYFARHAVWLLLIVAAASPPGLLGQAAWEFSPYQVNVCIAMESQPEFTPDFAAHTRAVIQSRSEVVFFAAWNLQASSASRAAAREMLLHWDELSFEVMQGADARLVKGDKLYLVAVAKEGGEYVVNVRELDLRTQAIAPSLERRCGTPAGIPLAAWDAIVESFVPLAKIETVQSKNVLARVRAGGLITDPASPALIQPGDALRVVIRRNDRAGEPMKGGIQSLPWTILSVLSRSDALLDCSLASGFRTPIPTRAGARMERLAVLARPRLPATRVVLQSKGKEPRLLTGYEIYVKGVDDQPTLLLGVTDWRGSIEIPRGDVPVRTLYVKNGNQLLARLPLVPGDQEVAVATTIEDDYRLQTEGFVMALQGRVTDLVARREILAARFRKRLAEGKLDEAGELLRQYQQLESRDELIKDLDAQQGRISQSDVPIDKLTRSRIDKLMGEARKLLLNRFLDPETKNVMAKELEKAKAGNAPVSTGK